MILKKNGDPTKAAQDSIQPTKFDQRVLEYLMSKGVDTDYLGEIPITRIIPGRSKEIGPGFAGAYFPGANMIGIAPGKANDPQVRAEEVLHALQAEKMIYPGMSGRLDKLASMLGVTEDDPFEDRYAVLDVIPSDEDPSRDTRESRDLEAEAKLMSLKIDLIDQGVLNSSGDVSEEDLYKIQEYMMNQASAPREERRGAEYFLQPYFRNLEDAKARKLLLKILNKV